MTLSWDRGERLWERAEAATRRVAPAQQQGRDARGAAATAYGAGKRAARAFHQFEEAEEGWGLAQTAWPWFRPDGRRNDRLGAVQQVTSALPKLSGRDWSKVRGFLQAKEAFPSLDRLHHQLRAAEPDEGLRGELVRRWWLRRRRPRDASSGVIAGSGPVAHLVQMVVCSKWGPHWRQSYRRISGVLRQTVRARSAVEWMNRVLRRHQARHRTVTQGLLDRKRLYWNCRAFGAGKRRGRCPYEHLGLKLPRYDFGSVLQTAADEAA